VLSAADPLNLVGILVPGERVPAISGKTVTFNDGVVLQTAVSQASEPSAAAIRWARKESGTAAYRS